MNEIFSLVGQIKEVYEMITDPDMDEQVVNDTLEGLMGELSVRFRHQRSRRCAYRALSAQRRRYRKATRQAGHGDRRV